MRTSDARVTARVYRDENGQTHKKYKLGDITVGSVDELHAALSAR
jgi:hypothetical protein